MRQMLRDLILGGGIRLLVGIDLDDASVRRQFEMVFCLLMRKSHGVVPALIHASRVLLRNIPGHGAHRLV